MTDRCPRCGGSLVYEREPETRRLIRRCIWCGFEPDYRPVRIQPDERASIEAAMPRRAPTLEVKVCQACGKEFARQRGDHTRQRFCSHACGYAGRGKPRQEVGA